MGIFQMFKLFIILFMSLGSIQSCHPEEVKKAPPKNCDRFKRTENTSDEFDEYDEDDENYVKKLFKEISKGDTFILYWKQIDCKDCWQENQYFRIWQKLEPKFKRSSILHCFTVNCTKFAHFCCMQNAENTTSTFYYRMNELNYIYHGPPSQVMIDKLIEQKITVERNIGTDNPFYWPNRREEQCRKYGLLCK